MAIVVLDAMGGDHAPGAILDGVEAALDRKHVGPKDLLLSGPKALLEESLASRGMERLGLGIIDAPDQLDGAMSPVEAMRNRPRNSIAMGVGALKEGHAKAFVSAGSTGTVVAAATMGLGTLEGIRRPGIACIIEGEKGPFMVVDVGANPQPKPQHLMHYGLMGSAYFGGTFGVAQPRVGLMNIGTEDQKGSPVIREARQLLKKAPIEFIGNVEGVDVFQGACDVVVCDGFTGNVLLKVSEGLAEHLLRTFAGTLAHAGLEREKIAGVVDAVRRRVDFAEYGGALLLGVNGIVTICHGRSDGNAIANAIRVAARAVAADVNQSIVQSASAAAEGAEGA